MDVFQFIGYLRQFSVDVALIGAAVWGIDLLLRRTLIKKAKGKLAAFLPFLLGIALYAAYAAATGGFAEGADAAAVLTEGMTCGSVATVLRVLFEGRGDAKTECVKALLAGYEVSDEAAKNIAARGSKRRSRRSDVPQRGEDKTNLWGGGCAVYGAPAFLPPFPFIKRRRLHTLAVWKRKRGRISAAMRAKT